MTDPENTLAAIDAAVDGWVGRDWSVSEDAMRSAPEPPTAHTTVRPGQARIAGRAFIAPVGTPVDAPQGAWTEIGAVEPSASGHALDGDRHDLEQAWRETRQSMLTVVEHVRVQWEGIVRAFAPALQAFAKVNATTHVTLAPSIYGNEYRRHRLRCRMCNPAGNPKPLKVDGADYARRRKNRIRRG